MEGRVINLRANKQSKENISIEREELAIADDAVAEEFACHFSMVGKNLAKEIEKRAHDCPNGLGTLTTNTSSIFLRPVTEFEISCLIGALN